MNTDFTGISQAVASQSPAPTPEQIHCIDKLSSEDLGDILSTLAAESTRIPGALTRVWFQDGFRPLQSLSAIDFFDLCAQTLRQRIRISTDR